MQENPPHRIAHVLRDHHRIRDAPSRPQVCAHVGVLKDRVGQVGARLVRQTEAEVIVRVDAAVRGEAIDDACIVERGGRIAWRGIKSDEETSAQQFIFIRKSAHGE